MKSLFCSFVFVLCVASAYAEPVVTIRNNGPAGNRLNLVVLGDGYTEAELLTYAADVDRFINGMFEQQPYADYAAYFNVHRVDVASRESGADHPERGQSRDTALGARFNCANIARLVCVDHAAVNAAVSRSVAPDERDIVLVIVNDPEYGGSGGSIAVASTHPAIVELVLHEMGHTLGLLADEYDTGACDTSREPAAVNVTRETAREAIKWNHWIDGATPLPTAAADPSVPGSYRGALFCPDGMFRPTYDSKMRSTGRAYDQINTEQLIKRFYNYVSPIDSVAPHGPDLEVSFADRIEFSVERLQPSDRDLQVRWSINGEQAGTGPVFVLDAALLLPWTYRVEVEVRDDTAAVRRDAGEALVERYSWNVLIITSASDARR